MSDDALLAAWRDGDREAGQALFERHFPAVYGFLADKVDAGAVDDVVQRTFLACVEHAASFGERGSFRAWLLGVARNQLLMHYRSSDSAKRSRERIEHCCIDELVATPSIVVAQREQQRLLVRALRRIPLELQLLLELFYWEDLGHAELAEILEMPIGTVKSRLHRARDLLVDAIRHVGAPDAITHSTIVELDAWVRSLRRS